MNDLFAAQSELCVVSFSSSPPAARLWVHVLIKASRFSSFVSLKHFVFYLAQLIRCEDPHSFSFHMQRWELICSICELMNLSQSDDNDATSNRD